jgi:hypothetical protein
MNRWAWRLFRREWRQQLLVLTLIGVAVAATVFAAGVATNTPPPKNATLGGAPYAVTMPGTEPHLTAAIDTVVSDAHQAGTSVQVVEEQRLSTGSLNPVDLRSERPDGPFARSSLALLAGRYPDGPGQVALTRSVASLYDVGVGDRWHAAGRSWQVTGLVENPDNLLDSFALVAPGQLPAPTSVSILLSSAPRSSLPAGATLVAPPGPSSGFSPATVVLVVALFGLLFVGMIAAAGFTVLAQRRLRALGMVSALGATHRDVRRVMVANGAVVGAIGAVVGAALGLSGWFAYAPHLQSSTGHRIDAGNLPWSTIAVTMAFAVLVAVRAARRRRTCSPCRRRPDCSSRRAAAAPTSGCPMSPRRSCSRTTASGRATSAQVWSCCPLAAGSPAPPPCSFRSRVRSRTPVRQEAASRTRRSRPCLRYRPIPPTRTSSSPRMPSTSTGCTPRPPRGSSRPRGPSPPARSTVPANAHPRSGS